jgi:hypothetical protein
VAASSKKSKTTSKKRIQRIPVAPAPDPPAPNIIPNNYEETIDPTALTIPVNEHVHSDLQRAWKINRCLPMWFVFDTVTPARQFKRGTYYLEEKSFADYGPEPWDDLTESDTGSPGWVPYKPRVYV